MVVEEDERTEGEVAVGGVSPAMSFFWRRLCTGKGQRAPNVLSGCCTSKASFCNHICSCLLSEPPPPQKKTKNKQTKKQEPFVKTIRSLTRSKGAPPSGY